MNLEIVPVNSLTEDPANVRLHPDRNIEAIKASLLKFGQQKPVVVDKKGLVIAGNGTLHAARDLGWETIQVVRSELTGTQATAYAIADNRTTDLSAFHEQELAKLVRSLQIEDVESLIGFNQREINALIFQLTKQEAIEDAPPQLPDVAITQPGDLWVLGDHRLLCGDSGNAADVDRLIDGQPIHLCNTDPPYNVNVEPTSGCRSPHYGEKSGRSLRGEMAKGLHAKDRPMANDSVSVSVSDDEFDKLLHVWFGNIARVLLPGRGFFIWGGYANCGNYPPVLKACELYFSQAIIWVKEHPVLTWNDFMGNHEGCFYGWREGAAHMFLGPNNATDVWSVKKVHPSAMIHLTEKPVELAVRAMQYSSRAGENVLDLFGGSGSTLIAAEQTGRRAFLMEIDPLYCDVIVQRWEKFTGRKAERLPQSEGMVAPTPTL